MEKISSGRDLKTTPSYRKSKGNIHYQNPGEHLTLVCNTFIYGLTFIPRLYPRSLPPPSDNLSESYFRTHRGGKVEYKHINKGIIYI